jgi:hypothetical protein
MPWEDVPLSLEPAAAVEEGGPTSQEQLLCGKMPLEPEAASVSPSAAAHRNDNETCGGGRSRDSRPGTYWLSTMKRLCSHRDGNERACSIDKHSALLLLL